MLTGLLTAQAITALNPDRWFAIGAAAGLAFWLQFPLLLLVSDFAKWCIHNLLHRVPILWEFHKVHHSIEVMDWIGNWRFHWLEAFLYRILLYPVAAFFGFSGEAMFYCGVLSTFAGHFAHANIRFPLGSLRYILNGPDMHAWHHAHPDAGPTNRNFGLMFSLWDWLFGTAYLPDAAPRRLGFTGIEAYPHSLWRQWLAPWLALLRSR